MNRRPQLEILEDRLAPAVLYVDNSMIGAAGAGNGTFTPNGGDQAPVAGRTLGVDLFTTIGAAVAAASATDTINVADGTYAEQVAANKAGLIFQGNQYLSDGQDLSRGTETIVTGAGNGGLTPFSVTAADVQIAGFTVEGATSPNNLGYGIVLGAGTAGSEVRNNVIQNNIAGLSLANNSAANQTVIECNLFRNNNVAGPVSGSAIYSDQFNAGGALTNVSINDNTFFNNVGSDGVSGTVINLSSTMTGSQTDIDITRNIFDSNGRAFLAFNLVNSSFTQNEVMDSKFVGSADLRLFEGVNNLAITNNILQGNGTNVRGMRVSNIGTGAPDSMGITFQNNSITGYGDTTLDSPTSDDDAGVQVDAGAYSGTLDAENNWWGSPTGPTTPNNPGGTGEEIVDPDGVVDFSPFLSSGTDTAPGTRGFQPGANPPTGETVVGTAGPDLLEIFAAGADFGFYQLNGGMLTPFTGITSFSFAGLGGNDIFRINNPAGGIFAPVNGIFYDGGGQTGTPGDSLEILGGASSSASYNFTNANDGTIVFVNGVDTANYTYTGLEPITDTNVAGIRSFSYSNIDNTIVLSDDTGANVAGVSRISANGGETVDFANPLNALVVNGGGGEDTIILTQMDAAFDPTVGVFLNGEAGGADAGQQADSFIIDSNGTGTAGGTVDHVIYAVVVTAGGSAATAGGTRFESILLEDSSDVTGDIVDVTATDVGGAGGNTFFGAGGSLNYSGVGASFANPGRLEINFSNGPAAANGDTVNVTSAPITLIDLEGNDPTTAPGDTLNFNAEGMTVTQTGNSFQVAGRQPVTFIEFETTNIVNSAPGGGTIVNGTAGDDTLVIVATDADSGFYTLNGGTPVAFDNITSFTFNGLGGNDLFQVNNPAAGLFAPAGGIFYNGGTQTGAPGDSLEILGGAHTTETHTFTPDGADGHNGTIALVNGATTANYTYTGLSPVLVNAGTPTDIIFNLPTGDGNNFANLEDNGAPGDNMSQISSGTFETTVFVNPTNSLTVNYGNDGETVTVSQLDPAFAPAMALDLNGGAGPDRLQVDFMGGNNVIPVNGINFDGAGGLDGILLLPGYSATTVAYALVMDAMSGNINVDGRLVTFTGQDSTIGIFDMLVAANRVFTFDGNDNIATLDTGFAANDGFSRIATTPDTSLLVDFLNPTASATVNLGNGNDTINVPFFDAVGFPTTATFNGQGGDDTFNITASMTTAYTVVGGETPAGDMDTLNYDAQGGTVTRTPPTGESGTILAPGFQPFTFSEIENVNIFNGVPTISIDDVTMAEGNVGLTPFTFTVTLSTTSTQTIVVTYTTQDGSATGADADYIPETGTVTFLPGDTEETITIDVVGDTKFETTENFFVTLTSATAGFTFSDAQGEGTITNDDTQPVANISDFSANEGNAGTTAFTFTVTLTNASSQVITIAFNTEDDQATVADADYQPTSGVLTFAPGTTTQTITVLVNGDTKFEDDEDFIVRISNPTNATINDDVGFGVILNDDVQPTISINDVTMLEGNAGTTTYTFTVTLSNGSENPITVDFTTQDNSATVADLDYVAIAGTLTFLNGDTTETITVQVNGDTKFEPDETFLVLLSNATGGATFTDANANGNILNDDAQPIANINDVSLAEGNAGTTAFTFTVTLTNASATPITIAFNTEDGQATVADADYQPTAGVLTFAPGQTTQTITVLVNGDTKFEGDENFIVRISNPTGGATINDDVGSGVILNDDVQPTISIDDVTMAEGDAGTTAFVFTVTLTNASATPITVDFTTQDGTATVGDVDYQMQTGTLIFAPNTTTQTITVLVNGDTKFEPPNETFFVNLSNATGGATFTDAQGMGTITNDDAIPTVSIDDVTMAEGDVGTTAFVFTVTLTNPSSQAITIPYTTNDGTATVADGDYVDNDGSITFAPNTTTQTITVLVNGDTKFEMDETFTVTLNPGVGVLPGDTTGLGTITNDDTLPTLTVSDATVEEGVTAVFTLTLSNPTDQDVVIMYNTTNLTASDADYNRVIGPATVTILAGMTTATVSVTTTEDNIDEPDETFQFNIISATNALVADGQGLGTITDDDAAPVITITDVTVTEGNAGTVNADFTVTLSNPSSQTVTVAFTTVDGTATAADGDYVTTAGTLTFAPGQTVMTITVPVNGDLKFEATETFTVVLSAPTGGAVFGDDTGIGTITNDDTLPSVTVSDAMATEGDPVVFTFTLSNPSDQTVTVRVNTTGGTATADVDYNNINSFFDVFFAPGETMQTLAVPTFEDVLDEADETFQLNVLSTTNATVADGLAIGTITDDDVTPVATINDVTVVEGAMGTTNAVFTVTLSGASSLPITIDFTTVDGTATAADGDYVTTAGTLTFAPGQTIMTITVPVNGDLKFEATETFTVVLSNATGGVGGTGVTIGDNTGIGTITNDDTIPTLTVSDATVEEGVTAVFTLTLSNPTDQDVVITYNTTNITASDADYNRVIGPATITILAGQTTATVSVTTTEDNIDESDETFNFNILSATNAFVADTQGLGTITDDDAAPVITITDVTVTEGNAGTTNAVFTVTLTNPSSQTVTVAFTTVDGTATTADDDYETTAGTLTFAPGQTVMTITVPVNGDLKFEATESFTVVLSAPTGGATLGDDTGVGTITNDDNQPTLSVSNATVEEGGIAVFTLTLSNPTDQDVVITYNTTSSTATGDVDYNQQNAPATVTILAGMTTATVSIQTFEDNIDEADETFFFNILSSTVPTTDGQGLGTITDDDAAPVITITDVTVTEGDAGTTNAVFTVTLSNPSSQTVTVAFTTVDGTATAADDDYETTAGTLTFAPGQTTMTISVPVNGDLKFEATESFTVVLSAPTGGAVFGDDTGTGTITNDDAHPMVSVGDAMATEGSPVVFTITLSNPSDQSVTVRVNTTGLTATANVDYNNIDSFFDVFFAPGTTTQTVSVPTFEDNIDEADETFQLNVIATTNATVADGQGVGTIVDNDAAPVITIDDVTVTEGAAGTTNAVFTVTLSNPSSQTVTVAFTTVDGTAMAADDDYETTAGTLTFAPGQTVMTISVPINGDLKFEALETFTVVLSAPTGGATLGDDTGLGIITNDDALPSISIDDVAMAEGNSGTTAFTFTVTLSNPSSQTVTAAFVTQDGTATTADNDYQSTFGTVTFNPGQTTQTVTVLVNGDTKNELDETFTVNLLSPSNATLADGQGVGTIQNDDPVPTVNVNDVTMAEGNGPGTTAFDFTISLNNPSGQAITITYTTNDGTATLADGDYVDNDGSVTFAPGETTKTVTVLVNGDTKPEADETFTVTITGFSPPGSVVLGDTTGIGTITNDDVLADIQVTKSDSPDPVIAGQNLTYTITLTNAGPSDALNVTLSDAVPGNTTFVSFTTAPGFTPVTPAPGGTGVVIATAPTLVAGATATFTFVVNVNANTPQGGTISNTVTAFSGTADANTANNTDTETTTVNAQADLSVAKTDSPDPVFAGNNLTYTITLSNLGPSDAQNVTLSDAIPANTTFVSAIQTSGQPFTLLTPPAGGTGTFTANSPSFNTGGTATFTLVVKVNANVAQGGTITNTVNVTSPTTDLDPTDNTDTETTGVNTQADVAVTKTDNPDPVIAGNNLTYTLTVSNTGPSDAQGVTLTDLVPAGTTFVSASQTSGPSFTLSSPAVGGTGAFSATAPTLAAGASSTFSFVVKVNANVPQGGTISNAVTVGSTTADSNTLNNNDIETTAVNAQADLAVTKADSPDPVFAGNNLTYTIVISNMGPSDAQNVQLTDVVPVGTTFVSFAAPAGFTATTPPAGGTGTVNALDGSLAAGASATFTLVVKVNANVPQGGTITNTATVSSTTTEVNAANNSDTETTAVNAQADLSVTKTDTPDPVNAGQNLTYTIVVSNTGPSNAQSVQLTDVVPVGTTFVSFTAAAGFTATTPAVGGTGTVTATAPTLAAGATANFTLVVKVNPTVLQGGTVSNTATVSSTTTEVNAANNTDTETTAVNAQADLLVTKIDTPDPVNAGQNLTYTIVVSNTGPSNAQNVQLTDVVPVGTTFVSFTAPAGFTSTTPPAGGTGTVTATAPTLAAGANATFTLVVNVNANVPQGGTVSNTATASSATTEVNAANNTDTETTAVNARADLKVTKTDTPDPVTAGSQVTYTIIVTNNGSSNAQAVTLTDVVPANTTFVSFTAPAGWTSTTPPAGGAGTVTSTTPTVAAGASATFTLVVKVNSNVPNNGTITNTATVSSTTTEVDTTDNTDTETTTVSALSDRIGVYRDDASDPSNAGQQFVLDRNGNFAWDSGDTSDFFGQMGDLPVVGDWNGDGIDQVGVVRLINNALNWILDRNTNGIIDAGDFSVLYGQAGDIPVVGDWDGDGDDDLGVFRGPNQFILDRNGSGGYDAGDFSSFFGQAGDVPVAGDFDGNGTDQIGVARVNSDGILQFIFDFNNSGVSDAGDQSRFYGRSGDRPIIGDWNGDGIDDVGVIRGINEFIVDRNGNGVEDDISSLFGQKGDIPLSGVWIVDNLN